MTKLPWFCDINGTTLGVQLPTKTPLGSLTKDMRPEVGKWFIQDVSFPAFSSEETICGGVPLFSFLYNNTQPNGHSPAVQSLLSTETLPKPKHGQTEQGQMRHYISSTAESACSVCICRTCVHVWEPSVTIATTQCLCKWKGSKWDLFLNETLIKKQQHGWDRALNNKCKVYSGFYHFTDFFFF